jgi:predicted dithiol-disulfide oxidoreductase (DUF899 family)
LRQRQRRTEEDESPHLAAPRLQVFDTVGKPLTTSLNGLPPHIAQIIAGHRDINVTLGYKAVYPHEAIQAHLAFLTRRRVPAAHRGIPHRHRRRMGRIPGSEHDQLGDPMSTTALPPVVDADTWQRQLDALRAREKAATRELDAIAAQRRRLPMVKVPDYTLEAEQGPVRLVDVFGGKSQLIVYNHMWFPGEQWQCPGCTGFTSQFTRLEFLDSYDARFVIVTQGPIDEALAYKRRAGNQMTWYSTANSPFGSDVGAPPGGGFAVNVFLRDGDTVYRTWHTSGRGTEQLSYTLCADRSAALWAPGGVAGLTRGLAAVAHLQSVGQLRRHCRALRARRVRTLLGKPVTRPGQTARSGASWAHDGRPPNCQLWTSMSA